MSLRNHWYIACESRELRSRPLGREVDGQHLAFFRDEEGGAQALADRCAHRQMSISAGKVVAGCLECPYHGWRFGADGACRHAPAGACGPSPARAAVRPYPVLERDDFVWVWMGHEPPEEDPYRFHSYKRNGWESIRIRSQFPAPVEACLESLLDHHHARILPWGRAGEARSREVTAVVRRAAQEAEVEFRSDGPEFSLLRRWMRSRPGGVRHTDRFILPSVSRADISVDDDHHLVISSQCTPIDAKRTQVYTVISYRFGLWTQPLRPLLEAWFRMRARRELQRMQSQAGSVGAGSPGWGLGAGLLGGHVQAMRSAAARGQMAGAAGLVTQTVQVRL